MKILSKVSIIVGIAITIVLLFYLAHYKYYNEHKVLSCDNKTVLKLFRQTIEDPNNYSEVTDWGVNLNEPLNIRYTIEYRPPDTKIAKTYCEAEVQNVNVYYNVYNQKGSVYIEANIIKP